MPMSAEIVNRAQSRLGMVLNGKWRLDEVLGVGGMATVYAAMHRNQKRVAVKMLHTELSLEEGVRTRFLREGYLANTVDHPSAVTVFDDDIAEDGSAFLVMELLEGETIHDRIARDGRLPVGEALRMADEVLDVLVAAHAKRIIHRDLKPENLFITRDGHVKVLDFGIARLRELTLENASSTASGFFMGTPAFMAPEHARGKWSEVDAPSDLWSVGATLFTMLTGKFVHDSETAMDTLVMAVTRRAPPIRTVMPELDAHVAQVLDRALAFEKEERWATAVEMQSALRAAASHVASGTMPTAGMGDERPPITPTFASPPYTPPRNYQATVRSARSAPQRVASDAPLAASLTPNASAPSTPRPRPRGSTAGVSATERTGAAPSRRKLTSVIVGSVAMILLALGAGSMLARAKPAAAPASTTLAHVLPTSRVAAGAAEGTAVVIGNAAGTPPPRATADDAVAGHAAKDEVHGGRSAAAPVVPPVHARAGARPRTESPLAKDAAPASVPGPSASAAASAPLPEREVPPVAPANPFDRRF